MPMFVHNFTSYFHEKQRDLYFVTFSQVKKRAAGIARRSGLRSHPGTPRASEVDQRKSPRNQGGTDLCLRLGQRLHHDALGRLDLSGICAG